MASEAPSMATRLVLTGISLCISTAALVYSLDVRSEIKKKQSAYDAEKKEQIRHDSLRRASENDYLTVDNQLDSIKQSHFDNWLNSIDRRSKSISWSQRSKSISWSQAEKHSREAQKKFLDNKQLALHEKHPDLVFKLDEGPLGLMIIDTAKQRNETIHY